MNERREEESATLLPLADEPLSVDRPGLGELGRAVYLSGGFLLLLVILITSDDFFRQWGLSLLGGTGVTLGYAFLAARNSLRRRKDRKEWEGEEGREHPALAAERSERNRDYAFDLLTAGVLFFLMKWMYPAAPYLVELDRVLEGLALYLASGVFGGAGLLSLREGVERFFDYRRAEKELGARSMEEKLLEPAAQSEE